LAHEVGRLAGLSGDRIGQWARRGYIRSSQSTATPRVYSYQDVAEAMLVHELEERGVALHTIRTTIERLRRLYGTDWPLTRADLSVPRDHPQARGKKRTIVVEDLDVGAQHRVMTQVDLERIATHLARGGWAVRHLPRLVHIEVDPDRLSGRPVIKGTRMPAEDAGRLAQTRAGMRTLREEYDLTDAQIRDAQRWWHAVQRYEAEEPADQAS
jgi:uncharacterized protein (DUF433 family)